MELRNDHMGELTGLPPVDQPGRMKALKAFQSLGFPGRKSEEYRMLPITRALEKHAWKKAQALAAPPVVEHHLIPGLDAYTLVYVNGRFQPEASTLPSLEGVTILPLGSALSTQDIAHTAGQATPSDLTDPFASLNTAMWNDGVYISVDENVAPDKPILLLYLNDSGDVSCAYHTRTYVHIHKNARVDMIEKHCSLSGISYHNYGAEIILDADAELTYCTLQEASNSIMTCNTLIRQADRSKLSTWTMTFEGILTRNNLCIQIDGTACTSHFNGLYLIDGHTITDNHTVVDHKQPHSFSDENYKGIIMENARGIFNGKIYVRPHAQKTNAFQSNRNILLSDTATMHTKPQLEIWADDVKCSHGSTSGQLDEEALFYLRSRGISEQKAKAMLVTAFAAEVVDTMVSTQLKTYCNNLIKQKLSSVEA